MVIQWLGHSSFLIISANGTKIITDPYESGAFRGVLDYKPIEIAPDIVTVSHEHADHGYIEGLPNHFEVVSGPGSRTVRGITFKGVESYHDTSEGAIRGTNTMIVMTVDGVRICHLGDLGQELLPSQVEELGSVHILMIPVGGYYTIGPEEANRVIDCLNPRIVIPMHFRTDKAHFPIAPVDNFLHGQRNVRRINSSEFETSKEMLPDEREIMVLQHAL